MISFYTKWVLWLIIPLLGLIYWRLRKRQNELHFQFPAFMPFQQAGIDRSTGWIHLPAILRAIALILLVIVIARPRSASDERIIHTEGIDIIIALDISSSMLAEDFHPQNRIEAAKVVGNEFIQGRESDRIGLIVFAGESYTQCPATLDYDVLTEFMDRVQVGAIEDGTAIGMALANALNRLRTSDAKSKVIILLTDGQNNRGAIDPITAAQAATPLGVKIYTIGVGSEGFAPYPVQTRHGIVRRQLEVKIDEDLLKQVASITGGRYFRATDENKLREIYKTIDKLEKTEIEVKQYRSYAELFLPYILIAAALILLEIVLNSTRLRRIP